MNTKRDQLIEMLQNEPHDSFLNYALALDYAKVNNVKKAIEIIEELLLRDENYLAAYYQLGKLYGQMNQPAKAIVIFEKGIGIAKKQNNRKTLGELNEALLMLED